MKRGGFSGALARWLLAYGTFSVPQAAGPIAFTLLMMPLTGSARTGAALVLAITIAQIIGSVPLARLGRNFSVISYLRALVVIRAIAFIALALLAQAAAPFYVLVIAATLGGAVNGAAFGFLRSILSYLVKTPDMPRALGLAATLNEFTFVVAPVLASVLGSAINPVIALILLVSLGTAPVLLVPAIPHATAPQPELEPLAHPGSLLKPGIVLWLACTMANSAAAAAVEIGAVAIAMNYGLAPAEGVIFTVALCVASVSGGLWVSARNRAPSLRTVPVLLLLIGAGAGLIAGNFSIALTVVGAITIGSFLAPLGTCYSLRLDALASTKRKAEVFALSRTANSVAIILISATLTLSSLQATLLESTVLVLMAAIAVRIASLRVFAARL
jgi:DHA1 family inner membrane transport protein